MTTKRATTKRTPPKKPTATANATVAAAQPALPSIGDVARLLARLRLPRIDVRAIAEWQRKDIEALVEANRQAWKVVRDRMQENRENLRKLFSQPSVR